MEALFLITIGNLVVKYGIPGALKIIKAWNVENPTIEDIKALPDLKPPEDYFK